MAHKVVKEVTQPVHGADGEVTHRPGDQFPEDRELPEGVPWRLAIAEADTAPVPAPAPPAPARARGGKGAAASG